MNRPVLLLLGIVVVTGGVGFLVTYWQHAVGPVIVVPETLHIGTQTVGETVHVPFVVKNSGDAPLVLTAFHTNCGCLTVSTDGDSAPTPLERITILPHTQITLRSGLVAQGTSGTQLKTWLRFATNDPNRPEVAVYFVAELQGAVVAAPSVLALGDLQPGEVMTRSLLIRDMGRQAPFQLEQVRSNVPDIITVVKTTATAVDVGPTGKPVSGATATHMAVVKVAAPGQPGPIGGQLDVLEVGSAIPLLSIPVTGQVVPRFRITPDSLVIPRRSTSGLLYAAKYFCTCTSGKPFALSLLSAPPGVSATAKKLTDSRYVIEVVAEPAVAKPSEKLHTLSFQAAGDGGKETLFISIRFITPD